MVAAVSLLTLPPTHDFFLFFCPWGSAVAGQAFICTVFDPEGTDIFSCCGWVGPEVKTRVHGAYLSAWKTGQSGCDLRELVVKLWWDPSQAVPADGNEGI